MKHTNPLSYIRKHREVIPEDEKGKVVPVLNQAPRHGGVKV